MPSGLGNIAQAEPKFVAVDVYIQSEAPLAAWQFEFEDRQGSAKVVGIENGDVDVFSRAPYYDRSAVAEGRSARIIVADYSLADRTQLPAGRIRVATLHLVVNGNVEPSFETKLIVASTYGGKNIEAEVTVEISGGRKG